MRGYRVQEVFPVSLSARSRSRFTRFLKSVSELVSNVVSCTRASLIRCFLDGRLCVGQSVSFSSLANRGPLWHAMFFFTPAIHASNCRLLETMKQNLAPVLLTRVS